MTSSLHREETVKHLHVRHMRHMLVKLQYRYCTVHMVTIHKYSTVHTVLQTLRYVTSWVHTVNHWMGTHKTMSRHYDDSQDGGRVPQMAKAGRKEGIPPRAEASVLFQDFIGTVLTLESDKQASTT